MKPSIKDFSKTQQGLIDSVANKLCSAGFFSDNQCGKPADITYSIGNTAILLCSECVKKMKNKIKSNKQKSSKEG
jgi:predicted nucleic acid-binding Zn ribbon protein